MVNQIEVVIVVPCVVRDACDDAETMTMVMMMVLPGLRGQPMQALAEERDANESGQQKIAQNSSIL